MDVFSRTFLPATMEALLPIPVVSRHMPYLRRCVTPTETTFLVSRCQRPGHQVAGSFLLVLTGHHLVVTHESRLLHRVRLHLATPLRLLRHVSWTTEARLRHVDLAMTTADGLQERFRMPVTDLRRAWHVDVMLTQVFRSAAGTTDAAPTPEPRPVRPAGVARLA
jgi:hypothetical protein